MLALRVLRRLSSGVQGVALLLLSLATLPWWEPAVDLNTVSSNNLEVVAYLSALLSDLQGGGGKEEKLGIWFSSSSES
jgi:hypothetical protein